jgi:hypothetical protein
VDVYLLAVFYFSSLTLFRLMDTPLPVFDSIFPGYYDYYFFKTDKEMVWKREKADNMYQKEKEEEEYHDTGFFFSVEIRLSCYSICLVIHTDRVASIISATIQTYRTRHYATLFLITVVVILFSKIF